jgi:hypothetical protein
MTDVMRIRRSRGMASGFLLALLGLWGALIPFIGPYFHYGYTPDGEWKYTQARLLLEILPGAAVFVGGVLLMISRARPVALFGAALASAAGAWFVLGQTFSPLWNHNATLGGAPASATVVMRIAEQVGFFTGLGVVVAALAAMAFGRVLSVPSAPVTSAPVSPAADNVAMEDTAVTEPGASAPTGTWSRFRRTSKVG